VIKSALDASGSCEHDSNPSGFIKGGEFLDYVSNYQLLKKESVPCS
jgi:hypothetical protein